MTLYAIKLTTTIKSKKGDLKENEIELLPYVYKKYTGAVECIKGFVKAQVEKNEYTAINDYSCEFKGKHFNYVQNYQVTELIEMD